MAKKLEIFEKSAIKASRYFPRPNYAVHTRNVVIPAMAEMFAYKRPSQVPTIKKIVVDIAAQKGKDVFSRTDVFAAFAALKLLTRATPTIVERKIKDAPGKGRPKPAISMVQCILTNHKALAFLEKLAREYFPAQKLFKGLKDSFEHNGAFYNYQIRLKSLTGFDEAEYEAKTFARLKLMRVNVHTTAASYLEAVQLLRMYKIPIVMARPKPPGKKRRKILPKKEES